MSAYRANLATSPGRSEQKTRPRRDCDCECTCGGQCGTTCCNLDCLEQPRFYCGQALNDTDLNAIVRWTKDKARLVRFRDGWGVACGLEVRCDPAHPAGIIVGPGYGMSCCGDDIVICADTPLDLGKLCKDEDPCAEPDRTIVDHRRPRNPEKRGEPGPATTTERIFDIYVRYKEVLGRPQASLGRCECSGPGTDCEYARTLESSELIALPASMGTDPTSGHIRHWVEGLRECRSVVDWFIDHFGGNVGDEVDAEAIRKWLVHWMEDHHPHQFCFLHEAVCDAEPEDLRGSI